MAKPSRRHEIDSLLLREVASHPRDLVRIAMDSLGLSRPQILGRVEALIEAGYLARDANPTRPTYSPGPSRRHELRVPLAGLEEHLLWTREVRPLLSGLAPNVEEICHYGFTEMVNNAIDHSGGTALTMWVDRNRDRIELCVADDGVGIFRKIAAHLGLPDVRLALLELAKGKLTTDPKRHTGEGVFFTSRVFDDFDIHSGELTFTHEVEHAEDVLLDFDDEIRGTLVKMEIAHDSQRTLSSVFERFSSGPDDYSFARTVVPVRLARIGDENLVSRSQAKRLLQRVDKFRIVVMDFSGVASVGQAFADEVFRVFAAAHPEVRLEYRDASEAVLRMIRRADPDVPVAVDEDKIQGDLFQAGMRK